MQIMLNVNEDELAEYDPVDIEKQIEETLKTALESKKEKDFVNSLFSVEGDKIKS